MLKKITSFGLGVVVGALVVGFLWANQNLEYAVMDATLRPRLIANGCAQYNPTNGVFEYKGHK